jgi:hypothetical protein
MNQKQALSDLRDSLDNAVTQIRCWRRQGRLSARTAAELIEEANQMHHASQLLALAVYRAAT